MTRKFMLVLTLLAGLVSGASASNEYKITNDAKKVIRDLEKKDFYYLHDGKNKVLLLKDTENAMAFEDLGVEYKIFDKDDMDKKDLFKNVSADTNFVQINSPVRNRKGVCESFASALVDGFIITKLKRNYYLADKKAPVGSIIISKPNKNKAGHIAVLMRQDNDGIWVIDQNAQYSHLKKKYKIKTVVNGKEQEVSTGIVSIHKLLFKGKSVKSTSNASTYFTIRK
jgi:hypothetical protein